MNTIPITSKIKKIISTASKVAIEYEKLTGRKLGITGEIGEVLVCDKLKLKLLANPLSAGYDAIDKICKRYQIKTRRVEHGRSRIGRFSKYAFDYAILAILDRNYKILELWRAEFEKLKPILDRQRRRNPSLREFKKVSKRIK